MIHYHWEVKHTKVTRKSFIEKVPVLYFEKGELSKIFTMGSQFVLGLPIAIFDLISERMENFRKSMII
jgi:hypothetical protein